MGTYSYLSSFWNETKLCCESFRALKHIFILSQSFINVWESFFNPRFSRSQLPSCLLNHLRCANLDSSLHAHWVSGFFTLVVHFKWCQVYICYTVSFRLEILGKHGIIHINPISRVWIWAPGVKFSLLCSDRTVTKFEIFPRFQAQLSGYDSRTSQDISIL